MTEWLSYPFAFDARGRTATVADIHTHTAHLVEQVLLTGPGERVMRSEFGAGLLDLVFEPGGDALGEATEVMVRAGLQRWLADTVRIESLTVRSDDGFLVVDLSYHVLATDRTVAQTIRRRE